MSSFESFRARIAEVRRQLDAGTARPLAPKQKTARPLQVAAHREHVGPEKPADVPERGPLPSPLPAPFSLPETGGAPSVTLGVKRLRADAKLERKKLGPVEEPIDVDAGRPKTRGDCFGGERPCPYVACRYHTYLEVTDVGSIVINRPDIDVAELKASCSLDIADAGAITLEKVGDVLNVTRERARQLEAAAIVRAERAFKAGEVKEFRGSCKAVCALSGRRCQLPAHADKVKHHDGRKAFHLVALPGQVTFPEKERLERAATAHVGEALHEH